MYKILNSQGLGVSGRQNELIELALTHKFNGVEVDMDDLVGRHDTLGKEFACQFLQSANIDVGTFELPIDLSVSDADFAGFEPKLNTIVDLAETLGAVRCYVMIRPTSDLFAFQENFEKHRSRLFELAEKFEKHNIRIGLALQAAKAQSAKGEYKFIQSAEELLTLVKTVGHKNVGLCLNSWEWIVGGGAMDQLAEIDPKLITEFRMADLSDEGNPAAIKISDRVMPGDGTDSVSQKMINYLLDAGYEGPFSVASDIGMFAGAARDGVVAGLSCRLDRLIARESLKDDSEVEAIEAESEGEEIASEEVAEPVVAATQN